MRLGLTTMIAVVGVAGLSACTPTTQAPVETAASTQDDRLALVPAQRAVQTFVDVCGGSLPRFANAKRLMAARGITVQRESGIVISPTDSISFKISGRQSAGKTCSMVFATEDSQRQVQTAFAGLGQFKDGPVGKFTLYDGKALVVQATQGKVAGQSFYNLVMLSER